MPRMSDRRLIGGIVLTLLLSGCSEDPRLHRLSQQSLDRQAEQNLQMGRQSEAVAQAAKQLVEADAQARREAVQLHQAIQQERAELDRQHEALEAERREIAATRQRDPIIADALIALGVLLATCLPLLLCLSLLQGLYDREPAETLEEFLIAELSGTGPGRLSLPNTKAPRIDAAKPDDDGRPDRLPPPAPSAD